MKLVLNGENPNKKKMHVYVCQGDFNAPFVTNNMRLGLCDDISGHASLCGGDLIFFVDNECFCHNKNNELIQLSLSKEFVDLNTPAIFKESSFEIKPLSKEFVDLK